MRNKEILITTLAVACILSNFSGCSNTNDLKDDENPISLNTKDIDISADTRIFTDYGFSVATTEKLDDDVIILKNMHEVDYVTILDEMMDKILSGDLGSILEDYQDDYSAVLVGQHLSMHLLHYFNHTEIDILSDTNAKKNAKTFLNVAQESFEIDDTDILKTIVSVKTDNQEVDDIFSSSYEIFTVSTPDNEEKYEVVFLNTQSIDTENEIENIVKTFAYDFDLANINEDGKQEFQALTFSAFTKQEYITNKKLMPFLVSDEFEDYIQDKFYINFLDESIRETVYLYIEIESVYDNDLNDFEEISVENNTFHIIEKEVMVKDFDENITEENLITEILYTDADFEYQTSIKLYQNVNYEHYIYEKEDFDMINSIFNDILKSYKVNLSDVSQRFIEVIYQANRQIEANLAMENLED